MTNRSTLFLSAAFLIPIAAPAEAQQPPATDQPSTAPATEQAPAPAPTTQQDNAAAAAAAQGEDIPEEQEIVVVGQRPRGSVVGDIPPENTLDARDVRATRSEERRVGKEGRYRGSPYH